MVAAKSAGMVFEDGPVPGTTGVTALDPIRLAILDSDSGFVRVLIRRADALGWQYRRLEAAPRIDEFVAMRVHAVVLDLAVLREGAWEFLERLASGLPGLAIVVCTGPSTVAQRVRGLRLGADDWVTKPAHPEEVLARVEAVARRGKRAGAPADEQPLLAGELEIRLDRFQAYAAGRSVDLTRREFELLQLLADAEGKVLEREHIYQAVWGYAMAHGDRSVDVFVRKLRHKLERASPDWEYIHTHFGVGYRFDAERLGEPESEPRDEPPTELRTPLHPAAVSRKRQAAPGAASAGRRAI